MSIPAEQEEACAYLRALSGAAPIETHISLVFVGRDTVWKLKKAVRLPYLDFSSLAARRHFAEREFALNGGAAPGLYRDVVPLVRAPDGSLGFGDAADAARAVEWVLRMARVPPGDFLDRIAEEGGLTPDLLVATADAVAAFHRGLPPVHGTDPVAAMRGIAEGNVPSARAAGLPLGAIEAWRGACLAELEAIAEWQRGRARDGFVRRAHGDLHLGNMCLWRGAPVPFDALEFDEALATIDLGYDLAFLLMDLDHRVGRAQANRVLNRYVARTGDAALTRGLPAFLSLRALIRAHVEASRQRRDAAFGYLRAAREHLGRHEAVIVAVGGLQGTGKTTLARALAPELGRAPGALVLRSDEIRKRRYGLAPEQRLPAEAYADEVTVAVFTEIATTARDVARGGHSVIADATFLDAPLRVQIEAEARAAGVPFIGLWLDTDISELEARVAARRGDASDATIETLHASARANPEVAQRLGPAWLVLDAAEREVALAGAREAVRSRAPTC
ncbi:MAG: AAA family ATPase [Alphaproteobacteria bacterium]|nr:AAA family ATPase [Alphaproteobacteria bacterium]